MLVSVSAITSLIWPLTMLAITGIGTGLTFSLNRIATTEGIPFIPYVFWSCLLSGVLLVGLCVYRRAYPSLRFEHLRTYLIIGVLGMALPVTILAFVAPNIPASVVALGMTLSPMMTYLLALALSMERFKWFGVGGIMLGLLGVLLIIVPETSLPDPDMALWVAISLLAPLCFALCAICEWALVAVSVFYAIFWLCFFEIVRLAGPVFFSISNYIATISGVVWGMVIFGEALSPWIWAALALMLSGLYLLSTRDSLEGGSGLRS